MAFQILQTTQENKQQPYRLNGLLMHLMDSASAVSNGTSKEGKFPSHGDSEEKMNWQCKSSSLQHLDAVQEKSVARLSLHLFWNITEFSRVRSWAEPNHGLVTAANRGKRQQKTVTSLVWTFNSTPQSWWRGGTETGAGSLLPWPEGSCGFRQRVVLQLSGGRQSLKFLCWIHIGSSVTYSS